jgi:farnesol dehydrogenase
VTGGTGFIGTHLVHRLVRTGVRVRALVRRRTGRPDPPFPFPVSPDEVDVVWGDITDPDAVAAAVAGASVVYHLAGHARAWSREERRSQAVNGGGTEHVCRAAARHGARLVHVSTNLVEGVEDTDDPRTALTAYQRSKLQGEAAVRRFVASGAHAVILRPTRVFGPGLLSQANSATLVIELYRRGRFRLRIADGDARANYVFVDDVVAGLLRSAEPGTGEDAGACYTLGGENATMEQFLAAVAAATGRRRAVVALPRAAVRLVAAAAEGLGLLGIEPFITRDWAELLSRDWPADSRRAEASLGYRPRPLSEGVTQTVRWLEAGRPSPYSPRN